MSFILKILDKVVKIENEVVIGRGAPFENLNDHKDVARAHAQIKEEKQKLWIKALDEEKHTFVNGKIIKPHKYVAITTKDKIQLGDTPIEVSKGITATHIEKIERFSNQEELNYPLYKIWGFLFIIVFVSIKFLSSKDSVVPMTHFILGNALFSLFMAILIKMTMFIGKYIKPHKQTVFLGKKGFTVHYSKSNMSILFKDIESYKNVMGVLHITAYGKEISLSGLDKYKILKDSLEKNCPNKRVSSVKGNIQGMILLIAFTIFYGVATVGNINLSSNISLMFIMLIAISLGFLILAFNPKYYAMFYKRNTSDHAKNKGKLILGSLIFLAGSYYEYSENLYTQKHLALAKNCLKGNSQDCRSIDMGIIGFFPIKKETREKIYEKSCEAGHKYACRIVQRKPASKN